MDSRAIALLETASTLKVKVAPDRFVKKLTETGL